MVADSVATGLSPTGVCKLSILTAVPLATRKSIDFPPPEISLFEGLTPITAFAPTAYGRVTIAKTKVS